MNYERDILWHGCYTSQTALLTPESVAHPAKMAPALVFRIFDHLAELGLLKPDDTVLDPMAGTGLTGLAWAAKGGCSVLVELEPRFTRLALDNCLHLMRNYCWCDEDTEHLRNLRNHLLGLAEPEETLLLSVMPSTLEQGETLDGNSQGQTASKGPRQQVDGEKWPLEGWALDNQGRICRDTGRHQSSPNGAYLDNGTGDRSAPVSQRGSTPQERGSSGQPPGESGGTDNRTTFALPQSRRQESQAQGQTCPACSKPFFPGVTIIQGDARHLSELLGERRLKAVTSPPYLEAQSGGGISAAKRGEGNYKVTTAMPGSIYQPSEQGTTPGQIGALPDKPLKAVASPPYDAQGHPSLGSVNKDNWGAEGTDIVARRGLSGDLEQGHGKSYLSAMRQVYAEIARVADVLVVVTKNPTRAGKLRRLDLETIALLKDTGWEIHCQHRAILFEEQEQGHLFEGSKKQTKGRLSFFKRLSWQKGNIIANHEDILVATRR